MSLLPALSALSYRKEVFVLLPPGSSWRPGRHLHSCGGTRREICHHSVPSHQHQCLSKHFSVHVCKGLGGSSEVTVDLHNPTPDPGSHAVTQESLVMLCVQRRCPRLLSPACGVPGAAPEAKLMVLAEVYLVAFILHPSITAPFEHLLDTIKRKD